MANSNLKPHIKRIVLAVFIIIVSLVQNTDSFMQTLFGASILYIVPAVICISMFQGEIISMGCALIAGVTWDFCSGNGHSFHTVFLIIVAYITSYIVQRRIQNSLISSILLCAIATLLHNITYWLLYIAIPDIPDAGYALFKFYIPSFIVTTIVGIVIYFIVRFIHKCFKSL